MSGLFLILLVSAVSLAGPAPSGGRCGFYLDLEKKLHCAEKTNYLTAYGYPYCEKFQSNLKQWNSKPLKRWVPETTYCLQEALVSKPCDTLEAQAIRTHSACYARSGFCKLGYLDRQRIFNVISWADLTSAAAQAIRLNSACGIGASSSAVHFFDSVFGVTKLLDKAVGVYRRL